MKKLLYILLFVPFALFGQDNYSLSFDGVDDYVNLGHADEFEFSNNNFSVSTWIKQDSPKTSIIVSNYYCYGDYPLWGFRIEQVSNSSYLAYEVRPSGYTGYGITNIADGNWHFVTFVRSGINYSIFLDGELELSIDINDNPVSNNIPNQYTIIGGEITQCGTPNHFFNGLISEFNIWDKALTQDEIQSYMNCQPTVAEQGLIGYWNFNEGFGDTVYDLSGNGNDGTIYGATYSEDVPESSCDYSILDQLNQSFDAWNVSIDLQEGWNMFGYGCPTSIDLVQGLSNHTELIAMVKDNNGSAYIPEFGFNGIGDLIPGFGYQIKLTDAIEGFSLCDWYVNDIPEDNIVSLQEENDLLNNENDSLQAELDCYENLEIGDYCFGGIVFYVDETGERGLVADIQDLNQDGEITWQTAMSSSIDNNSQGYNDWFVPDIYQLEMMSNSIGYGATDIFHNMAEFALLSYWSSTLQNSSNALYLHFYYSPTSISYSDTSSVGNVRLIRAFGNWIMGCMDSLACNFNPEANMSDASCEYAELGYDCDGNEITQYQVGDLAEGGIVFYVDETGQHGLVAATEDLGSYEWGCWGTELSGADGTSIGTGYQNTLDIVSGCSETPIVASEALAYESEGYSDWYLPSYNELLEMYNTLGNGGLEGNIGGFQNFYYWSSSEYTNNYAWVVGFGDGDTGGSGKYDTYRVRVIRAF